MPINFERSDATHKLLGRAADQNPQRRAGARPPRHPSGRGMGIKNLPAKKTPGPDAFTPPLHPTREGGKVRGLNRIFQNTDKRGNRSRLILPGSHTFGTKPEEAGVRKKHSVTMYLT